jgi:predicted permease
MNLLAYLRSAGAKYLRREAVHADMDEELRSHIELRADDLERCGLSRTEAERRARIEFGGQLRFKEECEEALGGNFIETLVHDARFSARVLRKSPGFTLVAVLTLALAIGANAVVFGILNGLILRPIDIPRSDSFYGLQRGKDRNPAESYPNYLDLRDRNRSFEDLAAYDIVPAAVNEGGVPARIWGNMVSGNYFDVIGLQPRLGRFFHASDEHGPGSAPYAVLSYAYWHNRYAEDPGVIGRTLRLNRQPFTIVGVAPEGFHGTLAFFSPAFFAPIVNRGAVNGGNVLNARGSRSVFMVMGHLKPGVTPDEAAADLSAIGAAIEKTYPKDVAQMTYTLARPGLYGDYLGRPARAFIGALMLLAGLILLAACANLGSLFAARASDRSREVALRLALGSSRNRILRQLFTEAALISLCGGALGLWGSVALLRALSVWNPLPRYPMVVPVAPDAAVYAVALVLAIVSGVLFSLVPARQVLRADPYQIIKAGPSGRIGRRFGVRDLLLAGQIALCAVLVTASIVALRGLAHSLHANLGFEPRHALLVDTDLNMAGYTADSAPAMQRRMLEAVQSVPGVRAAAAVDWAPMSDGWNISFVFNDRANDLRPANAAAQAMRLSISPEYFRAAGTTILAGRSFSWHDDEKAPAVAVINREFARKMFGSIDAALGRYYKLRSGARVEVVGVAEDGKYATLTEAPKLAMFLPLPQQPSMAFWLVIRAGGDPAQLGRAIRGRIRQLDSELPVFVDTWDKTLDRALFPSRMATFCLGVLGALGAMLSITGVFGMAAYSVSKRLRELGIRMALGAQPREVLEAGLGRAIKLLVWGSAAGLMLGLLSTKVLASIVYHATPRDPLVLLGAVLAMLLLGVVAAWIPAQRALSVDPLRLLREE